MLSGPVPILSAMTARRTTGYLVILSALAYFVGQAIALSQWDGLYLLSFNLIGDLGITQCDAVNDTYLSRYVCSPGHTWFNGGLILAGLLLLAAGVGLASQRLNSAESQTTVWIGAAAMWVAGLGLVLRGAVGVAGGTSAISTAAGIAQLIGSWLAVIVLVIAARRVSEMLVPAGQAEGQDAPRRPLLHGVFQPLVVALCVASIAGLGLLQLATSHYGLWERMAFDGAAVMWIFVGASLLSATSSAKAELRRDARSAEKKEKEAAVLRAQGLQ